MHVAEYELEPGAQSLAPLPEGLYCPDCGYDLRSLTSTRCPECGFGLEAVRAGESQIPWTYRRELGRFRAYWKTVWLVLRWPKQFCLEVARPVSYRDSQSFRWMTVAHAYAAVLAGSAAWAAFDWLYNWRGGETMW